jgi:membrane-bound inhibitor of C-type lysozyme
MNKDRGGSRKIPFSFVTKQLRQLSVGVAVAGLTLAASATDLTIHLPAGASVSRKAVQYQCDARGAKIGVPAGPFSVEYINGGGNSLVIVPLSGNSIIFSSALSASGARYTAQQFTWWEAKGAVTLYSDSLGGKSQSTCLPVRAK